eukprot:TRINITY_DN87793_c0_g1_i1.p1 TRINITY_DN87793_c0_g1~~TRINITY_DN87793_c0_g1_i1.p1  ORF type:complete len:735 (-),score=80.04 TRINITY_DN87793_c0_g1_i1:136-2340(-)
MATRGPLRVAVLGQKDAMIRALYELVQRRRTMQLQVLVISPSSLPTIPRSANVSEICASLGFEHLVGRENKEVFQALERFDPQLLVSILWPRKITTEMLALCENNINFHPSLLPRHRGSLTQFWSIFEGDKETGSTCHHMVENFDAGRILHQVSVTISSAETALSLSHKIVGATDECFRHVFGLFLERGGSLPEGEPWDINQFPYHFRKIPGRGVIDPTWPNEKIDRFVRAMYFPPLAPAKALDDSGRDVDILDMQTYLDLRAGTLAQNSLSWHVADPATPCHSPSRPTVIPAAVERSENRPAQPRWLLAIMLPVLSVLVWIVASMIEGTKPGPNPNIGRLHSLGPDHPRARCMDGSPMTYYVAPSSGAAGRGKWLLYFQGGGWCSGASTLSNLPGYSPSEDAGHPDLCEQRARGYHGSSSDDRQSRDFSQRGFLSGNPAINPMMYNWNRVLLRNCDGTLFLGNADMSASAAGGMLHLRGHDNALAVVQALLEKHGLDEATEVVLAGCSAGGVAVVMLADELRRIIQAAVAARMGPLRQVFVVSLADSGIFPEWRNPVPRGVLHFPQFQWLAMHANVTYALPQACRDAGHAWRCLFVGTALPYVSTPVFVLQSMVDSWHVVDSGDRPALEALRERLREEAVRGISGPHGAAIDNCFHHCEAWGDIVWGGLTNREVFENWYIARREAWVSGDTDEQLSQGWSLIHVGSAISSRCYRGHAKHASWHKELSRHSPVN